MRSQKTNIADATTSFVGRVGERQTIIALFREAPLVTLFGGPGSGKTRLARKVAREALASFDGGAWFCDLAGVSSTKELLSVIVGVLRLRCREGAVDELIDEIRAELGRRGRLLLLLDNFEHLLVVGGAEIVERLLGTPATVLVTSREVLRVTGEHRLEVDGLSERDGARLFEDRARAVRPNLSFADGDWDAALEIARVFDGNPLAIELAAARVGVVSPTSLRDRLPQQLDILRAHQRTIVQRHASLRAAVQWSWTLLSAWERSTLAQVSVFRSAFTVEAAERVVSLAAHEGRPPVLSALEALQGRSLISTRADGDGVRFHVLASVREFARDQIDDDGAAATRHAAYFAERCQAWARDEHLETVESELDDAVAAFRHAVQHDGTQTAQLALALDSVLHTRGPFPLRFAILEDALKHTDGIAPDLEAELWVARGVAQLDAGHYDDAIRQLVRARELADALDDQKLTARILLQLGNVGLFRGNWSDAQQRYQQCLDVARKTDTLVTAKALNNLALVVSGAGDVAQALALYEEALALRGSASPGTVLVNIGQLHHQAGKLTRARVTLDDAVRDLRRTAEHFYLCFAYVCRAWLAIEEHALRSADKDVSAALDLLASVRDARLEGLIRITEGVLAASRDLIEASGRAFRLAGEVLAPTDDRGCLDALYVAEGFLDMARARAAGREDVEHERMRAARARVSRIEDDADNGVVLSEARVPLRLLEQAIAEYGTTNRLHVGDGWFEFGTTRVDLSRRRSVRLLFEALVEARMQEHGPLSLEQVVSAAWPGERMDPTSASRRVYVTIHTLRKLGLEDVLMTTDEGYQLHPETPVVRVREDES